MIKHETIKEEILIPIDLAEEFVKWADNKSFCNSGQHICDRLANYLAACIEENK